MPGRRSVLPCSRISATSSPGKPDGRNRQRLPGRFAVQLLRHRHRREARLLRRHHQNRRRTGAADETPGRRGPRPVPHPPKGKPGEEFRPDLHRTRAFTERYSNSTREVAQDGRRGALMLSVSIKHPDSERFIDAKMTEGKVTGANVSVRIDDAFTQAAESGAAYVRTYPTDAENPKYTQETDARRLWGKIVHNAWKSAEPGVLFRDTVIRESVPDCYADLGFRTISTNPLRRNSALPIRQLPPRGRQPLQLRKESVHAAGRVRLRPIPRAHRQGPAHRGRHHRPRNGENRPHHRKNTGRSGNGEVKQTELNLWNKIREKTLKGRRTGCGITGEGDMLAALGLRYGTPEATGFSTEVRKTARTRILFSIGRHGRRERRV